MRTVGHDDIADWSVPLHSLGAVERIVFTCVECGRVTGRSPVDYGMPRSVLEWPLSRVRARARCGGMCHSQGRKVLPRIAILIREASDPWPEVPLNPAEEDILREWDMRTGWD